MQSLEIFRTDLEIHIRYIAMRSGTERIAFTDKWLAAESVSFERSNGIRISDKSEIVGYDSAQRLRRF